MKRICYLTKLNKKKNDIYVAIKDIVKFQENLEKSLCSTCYTCINSKIFRKNVP